MNALQVFRFENAEVRTLERNGEPWFVAKDVADILDLDQPSNSMRNFPDNEKGMYSIHTPGGQQEMLIVNEPGLYRLIFQSRKAEAEKFKTWVFTDVLPSIRKNGGYMPEAAIERFICAKITTVLSNMIPARLKGPSRNSVLAYKDISGALSALRKWQNGYFKVSLADLDRVTSLLMSAKSRLAEE